VGRRGKDRAEARRVDPEQDGPVLEERAPVAPLGAADELLPVELDLAAPRPREAEGRRRALVAGDPDHLDGRPQRAEPGGEPPPGVRATPPRRSPCSWRRRWARSRAGATSGRAGCPSRP